MSELKSLLKNKSYSELNELEQAFILQNMSAEDYEKERQIVIMTEKLKLRQAHLSPEKAIKAELMAKMRAKKQQNWLAALPYGIAASLLLYAGIFYFSQKKASDNLIISNKIEVKENKNVALIVPQNTDILDTSNVLITELKTIIKKPKKQNNKPVLLSDEDAEEKALLLSFNRKNPNLEWQSEDEEEDLDKSTLKCTAN
jgi:hypothetical protein